MPYPHGEPDPFEDAVTEQQSKFFGRVNVDVYYAVFIKEDKWKLYRYDQSVHGSRQEVNDRDDAFISTQVKFEITPVDPTRGLIPREMGAHNNKNPDFRDIVNPSIVALADDIAKITGKNVSDPNFIPLRAINELWVSGSFVPQVKDDRYTTLYFEAVYPDKITCDAAYQKWRQEQASGETPLIPFPGESKPEPVAKTNDDAERQQMVGFLVLFWRQALTSGGELEDQKQRFYELIAANPSLAKHFDKDSAEVKALVGGA